jgi:hypothetical protein
MRLRRRREPEATTEAAPTATDAGREEVPVAGAPGTIGREAPAGGGPRGGEAVPGRRRRVAWRAHDAAGATAGAIGSAVLALARLVMTVAALIALLIALAIVLRDVDANASNSIVEGIHEGANFFAGSFTGLIKYSGHPKRAITIDWGLAVLAYLLAGAIVARFIGAIGRRGLRFERRHRAIPTH